MENSLESIIGRVEADLIETCGSASENSEALVKDICSFFKGKDVPEDYKDLLENYRINLCANGECSISQRLHDQLCDCISTSHGDVLVLAKDEVAEIEDVGMSETGDNDLPYIFNFERPYVISINSELPKFEELKKELIEILKVNGLLNKVVFDKFGYKPQIPLGISIGSRVQLEIAQAIIKVFAGNNSTEVIIEVEQDDGDFGYTQKLHVGIDIDGSTTDKELIKSLLDDKINHEDFLETIAGKPIVSLTPSQLEEVSELICCLRHYKLAEIVPPLIKIFSEININAGNDLQNYFQEYYAYNEEYIFKGKEVKQNPDRYKHFVDKFDEAEKNEDDLIKWSEEILDKDKNGEEISEQLVMKMTQLLIWDLDARFED